MSTPYTLQSTPSGKVIFSGIQPSGNIHLGNYLGAIKQWVALQENNKSYYCIVDHHAITVDYDVKKLPDYILDAAAMYLAAGLDPEKSVIFVQSHVPAHTELAWLLGTITPYGELSRMTQFKDKSAKQKSSASLGLFAYPVLMAADILLYQAESVPVGEDQTQHIELVRDIAKRFNGRFGDIFTIPEAYINKSSARIMSLTDPTRKMSKSDADKSYIGLKDSPDLIRKKIASAVTETEPVFSFDQSGPAVTNLLNIYKSLSGKDNQAIESEFAGKGYKEFKEALSDVVIAQIEPLQKKFREIRQDEAELRVTLGRGMHKAQSIANATLHRVKEAMGLM